MIFDGKALAEEIKEEIAAQVATLREQGRRAPGIALVTVGDDPASLGYVAGKERDALSVGFHVIRLKFPLSTSQRALLDEIEVLNGDARVDGIMVQLPLPRHIDEDAVVNAIRPDKDVDGFHPSNVAALWLREPGIVPCTPRGIMRLLERYGVEVAGKNALVIGRSNIVGLPVAKLLLDANATVTIAHSLTDDLGALVREADIVVTATGQFSILKGDMLKPGAVVVDVGIAFNPATGRLQGDADFESCEKVAWAITPVPGGVGPLTKASLMENTLKSYLQHTCADDKA